MILFTSLLLSLASFQLPLAWQPLPLSTPEGGDPEGPGGDPYDDVQKDLKYRDPPAPPPVDSKDSYYGPENMVYDEDYVTVPYTPPSPLPEQIPPQPDSSYVWMNGYWRWKDDHWKWIYGEWVKPPFEGAKWQPGVWERREDRWYWKKGRWQTP